MVPPGAWTNPRDSLAHGEGVDRKAQSRRYGIALAHIQVGPGYTSRHQGYAIVKACAQTYVLDNAAFDTQYSRTGCNQSGIAAILRGRLENWSWHRHHFSHRFRLPRPVTLRQ